MAKSNTTSPLRIIEQKPSPRARTNELLNITGRMSDIALFVLADLSDEFAGKYPRHPKNISADANLLKPEEIKLMEIVELVSDHGLDELIKKAVYLSAEYPKQNCEILDFKSTTQG